MPIKLLIPGEREAPSSVAARGAFAGVTVSPVTHLLDAVEVVEAFNLSAPARNRAAAPAEFSANDDDILEIEVEGGFTLWTSAERYRNDLRLLTPDAVGTDGSVVVDKLPRTSVSERGVKEWFQSALRVLRLKPDPLSDAFEDPGQWPVDFVRDFGIRKVSELTAWLASKLAMRLIEDQLSPGPGLYRWADATTKRAKDDPQPAEATFADFEPEKPLLVFIHGTASSTLGSFGAFLTADAQPHWHGLQGFFGEHMYAFEHRTMSESPIDNALQLVSLLPRHANLYLVSHSRGGMVGDLVCLRAMDANRIARFKRHLPELAESDAHDRAGLEKLAGLLAEKQFRVQRFVRCAAPARGTLLASENIDTFLSVLTNLVGLIPGLAGSPLYEVVKRTTLQIVKNRTRPELIPGIEAMIPTSPLVAFLNASDEQAGGTLGVVAGDIEGGSWLKRLGVFLTDYAIYEARDNDLVVNTDSMFNGARRAKAYYVFDQGSDVSHFHYFNNDRTRAALLGFLSADPDEVPDIFNPIGDEEVEPVPMLRSLQARAGISQPVVFVLPEIMGSDLTVSGKAVWLDYIALRAGGLGDLSDVDAKNVQAAALIGDYYRKLCDYLAHSHEVIPFAYDWRRSVSDAAKLLAGEVEKALNRNGEPVRLLAHGMGGLVARSLIRQRPDLWERICERDGGRFVMLGTPNRGSHAMVEALLGTATTVQQLALLDVTRSVSEITSIIARFPGALELLPNEEKFFNEILWKGYRKEIKTGALPAAALLSRAKATLESLASDTPLKHVDRVLYVAGLSDRTVREVKTVNGKVVLDVTTEGDGRVTYESGRLPGVATWYMDAEHGDLADHEPAFPALADLLEQGTTSRLRTTPLSMSRGGAATYRTLPEPVLYPTEASLAAGVHGKKKRKPYVSPQAAGFSITVRHGDLRYAKYPIVVGHYEGDTIIGAEAQIDALLDGALSQRYALGLYPGEIGSLAVVLRQSTPLQKALGLPNGAVVIGLGKWGELTASQAANLIRRAALQYVLQLDDCQRDAAAGPAAPLRPGLSVLLIGGNSAANISIGDSAGAILRGIAQANRELQARNRQGPRIANVEIMELYADSAIEAAHAVKRLAKLIGDELGMKIDAAPLLERGGEGRTRLTPVSLRAPWRRWEISVVQHETPRARPKLAPALADRLRRAILETKNPDAELLAALADMALVEPGDDAAPHRAIRFLTLSDRARAEATTQQRQPELIERLIQDSVVRTEFKKEEARVLFELMIPNELKDGLSQVDNVVFVVDSETAAYPWELMHSGEKPICVEKGLVRQLQTARYRHQIGARAGQVAYVVGDPLVNAPYRQLPGARSEAVEIAKLLRTQFEVPEPKDQPTALEVLSGLYERPYRIVHLAGHGQYESPTAPGGKARSGLVLDNGVFLTAVEIGQMIQVPELVFLNCCHIGQTGPERVDYPSVEFNRLAASVSRELIEMGVRAVVAAGWAVRDDAALHFAGSFYTRMLDGESFGRALKEARADTYQRFEGCNTWGAYQAYGDPDYRLDPSASRAASSLASYVDVAEFVDAIKEIQRSARRAALASDGGQKTRSMAQERLDSLVKACPPGWLSQTSVLMEIGYACGELGNFDAANRYLLAALESDESESATTLRAVEQLANFEVRLARDVAKKARDQVEKDRSRAEIDKAINRIEKLLQVSKTGERLSLLGGAYKRKAEIEEGHDQAAHWVRLAADQYRKAHLHYLDRKRFDPYPVLNWLGAELVLRKAASAQPEGALTASDIETLLQRCEAAAGERFQANPTFFEAVNGPDAALLRALATGALEETTGAAREIDRLAHAYLEVIRRTQSSAREIDSTLSQMELTENLIKKIWPENAATRATVAALRRIGAAIAGNGPGNSGKAAALEPTDREAANYGERPPTATGASGGKKNQRLGKKTAGAKKTASKRRRR